MAKATRTYYIEEENINRLGVLAKANNRMLSGHLEHLIEEDWKRHEAATKKAAKA